MFDATSFLVLAGSVNRVVEIAKPALQNLSDRFGWTADAYAALVQGVSLVLGVLMAFVAGGANLLPATLNLPAPVGVVLTGIFIGLGADAVNAIIDLVYGWQKPAAPVVTTSTPVTQGSETKVDVTTSAPAVHPVG